VRKPFNVDPASQVIEANRRVRHEITDTVGGIVSSGREQT